MPKPPEFRGLLLVYLVTLQESKLPNTGKPLRNSQLFLKHHSLLFLSSLGLVIPETKDRGSEQSLLPSLTLSALPEGKDCWDELCNGRPASHQQWSAFSVLCNK